MLVVQLSNLKNEPTYKLHLDLMLDWVTIAFLIAISLVLEVVEPFHRVFSLEDLDLYHPFSTQETVPIYLLLLLLLIVPTATIVLMSYLKLTDWRSYLLLVHTSLVAFLLSVVFTGFFTNFGKVFVGRPRPDFLARCKPSPDTPTTGYVTSSVCTTNDSRVLSDGFRSFPSGHSSIAFASFNFLAIWLAGQFSVFSSIVGPVKRGLSLKAMISSLPIVLASYVAISRLEDYRHRGSDVLSGIILGISVSWIVYRMYFPSLTTTESDIPHIFTSLKTDSHFYSSTDLEDCEDDVININ